jgi:hypothetical protein
MKHLHCKTHSLLANCNNYSPFPDPPSSPGLTVAPGRDLVSFNFTITPSIPPDCVDNYTITAASSDGNRNVTVPADAVGGSTPVNVDGFNLCTTTYTFTVALVTSDGQTGPASASVDYGMPGISGMSLISAYCCLRHFLKLLCSTFRDKSYCGTPGHTYWY